MPVFLSIALAGILALSGGVYRVAGRASDPDRTFRTAAETFAEEGFRVTFYDSSARAMTGERLEQREGEGVSTTVVSVSRSFQMLYVSAYRLSSDGKSLLPVDSSLVRHIASKLIEG
jgi:hypothetical protein